MSDRQVSSLPSSPIDWSRLRAPSGQGEVLIEPAAASLAGLVAANRAALDAFDRRIMDLSFREVRRETRARILGSAGDAPVVVTGHQPGFIHAGVWAKHVAAQRLAKAVGGVAVNLVVDSDAPQRTVLDVPVVSGSATVAVQSIAYATWTRGAAYESMPAASAPASEELAATVRNLLAEHYEPSLLPVFFAAYGRAAGADDWVDQVRAARRAVEQSFGVELADRRVSRTWGGPLLGMLLADARCFAAAYNWALAEYRRRHGIRSRSRPVPDLVCERDRCETPVWVDCPGEPRRRLFVRHCRGAVQLLADQEVIGAFAAECLHRWDRLSPHLDGLSPWRLRPRALTLTLWARLLFADLFIHGLGGALYDQVTDHLIGEYFGLRPPGMACVSATLRLGLPRHDLAPDAVAEAQRRIRDVRHNPQRFVAAAAVRTLVGRRDRAIERSRELREQRPADGGERRRVFEEIRAVNERIAAVRPELFEQFEGELAVVRRRRRENALADRRDYFFAMHTRTALEKLLAELPGVQDWGG